MTQLLGHSASVVQVRPSMRVHAYVCSTGLNRTPQDLAVLNVGNIMSGDANQTQLAIDAGALQAFVKLLRDVSNAHATGPRVIAKLMSPTWLQDKIARVVKKEILWAVSNVTAGTATQVEAVGASCTQERGWRIGHPGPLCLFLYLLIRAVESGLVHDIVELTVSDCFDVMKEAIWAVANVTSNGSPSSVSAFVRCGCIPPLVEALSLRHDARLVGVALEGALPEGDCHCL